MTTDARTDVGAEAGAFFRPLANTRPFLKVGAQGFAGSGKTYTLFLIALGLHKKIGSSKPIVIFDTERSSKFLSALAAAAGVEVIVKESRSLADLAASFDLCVRGASDILMIDSISHVWEDYLNAYQATKKRTFLQFEDWGVIKPTWKREFSDRLVMSPIHVLFTGRAGYEYGSEVVDKGDGKTKREIYKSGVKMKVEGETAYEPDLLVLMERFELVIDDSQPKSVWREATILKDRSGLIDGKTIQNPAYEAFAPVVDFLLSGAAPRTEDREGDTASLFENTGTAEAERNRTTRAVLLEEIEGLMIEAAPGLSAAEKAWKVAVLDRLFGTRSWKAVTMRPVEELRAGKEALQRMLSLMRAEKAKADAEGRKYEPVVMEGPGPVAPAAPAAAPAATSTAAPASAAAPAPAPAPATPPSAPAAADNAREIDRMLALGKIGEDDKAMPDARRDEHKAEAYKAMDALGYKDVPAKVKRVTQFLGTAPTGPLAGWQWKALCLALEIERAKKSGDTAFAAAAEAIA